MLEEQAPLGDAYTFNHSRLKEEIVAGKLLNEHVQRVGNVWVRPCLVADWAFALSSTVMKGFPRPVQPANKPFNDAVISARKTVEMGFGGAKKKFHILMKGRLIDPEFAADVALSLLCVTQHMFSCITGTTLPSSEASSRSRNQHRENWKGKRHSWRTGKPFRIVYWREQHRGRSFEIDD